MLRRSQWSDEKISKNVDFSLGSNRATIWHQTFQIFFTFFPLLAHCVTYTYSSILRLKLLGFQEKPTEKDILAWHTYKILCQILLSIGQHWRVSNTLAAGGLWSLWLEEEDLEIRLNWNKIWILETNFNFADEGTGILSTLRHYGEIYYLCKCLASLHFGGAFTHFSSEVQLRVKYSFVWASTHPPPELPLAADFIDSFSALSTARPCTKLLARVSCFASASPLPLWSIALWQTVEEFLPALLLDWPAGWQFFWRSNSPFLCPSLDWITQWLSPATILRCNSLFSRLWGVKEVNWGEARFACWILYCWSALS